MNIVIRNYLSGSFLLERELMNNTVLKTGFVGTHGARMAQYYSYNNNPPAYVWYTQTGLPFPTGEFANVARRADSVAIAGNATTITNWGRKSRLLTRINPPA